LKTQDPLVSVNNWFTYKPKGRIHSALLANYLKTTRAGKFYKKRGLCKC
jgi:hypothetical protein